MTVITTGFVDAHSHLRSTDLTEHGAVGSCLEEALLRMTAMTAVDTEDDVFVACSDLIASGVTGVQIVIHSFADVDGYAAMVDALIRGVHRSGIRALLILAITDQAEYLPVGHPVVPRWPTEPTRGMTGAAFIDLVQDMRAKHPDVDFGIGPVGVQWCSDELLDRLGGLAAEGLRVHTHLLESSRQRHWADEDPISRLRDHGLLGHRTSLAHGVWCTEADLHRIRDAGAQLVTCPHSNTLLNSGRADVAAWRGIPTGVGLDSVGSDAWSVARDVFDEDDALRALTTGGVACTDLGCAADQVEWRDRIGGRAERVLIDGRECVRDGALVHADEVAEARERVAATMNVDRAQRNGRQAALTAIMDDYLRALDNAG
jgi:cytosine/adenosine deaminase-related metal-dependent hydrolase